MLDNDSREELKKFLKKYKIKNENIDCEDIAEDFLEYADKGEIIRILPIMYSQIEIMEFSSKRKFDYHSVYTDGRYVYDPRYSREPILIAEYFDMVAELNYNSYTIKVIERRN